jgi:multisubunit Na+/H+ antiporter MnhG subunit
MPAPRPALLVVASLLALSGALATPRAAHAVTTAAASETVPWIADDYAKALAEARARRVPIFVESWAPW